MLAYQAGRSVYGDNIICQIRSVTRCPSPCDPLRLSELCVSNPYTAKTCVEISSAPPCAA